MNLNEIWQPYALIIGIIEKAGYYWTILKLGGITIDSHGILTKSKYNMSFTVGGLLLHESCLFVSLFHQLLDWHAVQQKALTQNTLQIRTVEGRKRVGREVAARLMMLSQRELEYFIKSSAQEQGYLLWLAVCRRYRFIAEFAEEVLREHFIRMNDKVDKKEYDAFFNNKAEWHSNLDTLTQATRKKLRSVLFRILQEANLIIVDGTIQPLLFSSNLLSLISQEDNHELVYFPGLII